MNMGLIFLNEKLSESLNSCMDRCIKFAYVSPFPQLSSFPTSICPSSIERFSYWLSSQGDLRKIFLYMLQAKRQIWQRGGWENNNGEEKKI